MMFERPFGVAARRRRALDALIRHISESSVTAICRLVYEQVGEMNSAEARGYVRARAAREIRLQARRAFAQQPGVDSNWQSLVVLRATERVVPLAMRQLSAMHAGPGQRTERRAA